MAELHVDAEQQISEVQPQLARPSMYQVILLNDDYTPMDFVIEILKRFFAMQEDKAAEIMWQIHSKGRGICGVYSRDIAETKVKQTNEFAQNHEHPLLCVMEPVR